MPEVQASPDPQALPVSQQGWFTPPHVVQLPFLQTLPLLHELPPQQAWFVAPHTVQLPFLQTLPAAHELPEQQVSPVLPQWMQVLL